MFNQGTIYSEKNWYQKSLGPQPP